MERTLVFSTDAERFEWTRLALMSFRRLHPAGWSYAILDCGMSPGHAGILAAFATIFATPVDHTRANGVYSPSGRARMEALRLFAGPARLTVYADSDGLFLNSIDTLIDRFIASGASIGMGAHDDDRVELTAQDAAWLDHDVPQADFPHQAQWRGRPCLNTGLILAAGAEATELGVRGTALYDRDRSRLLLAEQALVGSLVYDWDLPLMRLAMHEHCFCHERFILHSRPGPPYLASRPTIDGRSILYRHFAGRNKDYLRAITPLLKGELARNVEQPPSHRSTTQVARRTERPSSMASSGRATSPLAHFLAEGDRVLIVGGRTGWANLQGWTGRVHVVGAEDVEAMPDESVDLLYLDDIPQMADLTALLSRCWPKLKAGGVLAGHGYMDGKVAGVEYRVRSAVDVFAARHSLSVRLTLDPLPTWYAVKAEHRPATGSLKIGLMTACDQAQKALAAVSGPNKSSYCKLHGYEYIERTSGFDSERHPVWGKIKFLREALPRFDWLFWSDVDSLIVNRAIPLEEFLPPDDSSEDIVIGLEDVGVGACHVNAGQFFVRRSAWSLKFLDEWYQLRKFDTDALREQRALVHLIESRDLSRRVRLAPQRHFNSYPDNYRFGDFLLHFPDMANLRRGRLMHEVARSSLAPIAGAPVAPTPLSGTIANDPEAITKHTSPKALARNVEQIAEAAVLFLHHRADLITMLHLERLRRLNPSIPIIPLAFRPSGVPGAVILSESEGWVVTSEWEQSDRLLYRYCLQKHHVRAKRYIIREYDCRWEKPVSEVFASTWDAGLAGAQVMTPEHDPQWLWWARDRNRLPLSHQAFACGITPLAACMIDGAILEAIARTPDAIPLYCELRLATFARFHGAQVVCVPNLHRTVHFAADHLSYVAGAGVYHPIKNCSMDIVDAIEGGRSLLKSQ